MCLEPIAVYWNHKCLFVRRESALILFSLFAQSRFPWLIKARVKSLKKSSLPFDSAHLARPGVNICPKKIETVDFGFWEFWNCLLGCLSDFLRTVYQILFTLSNDENKYHHWWFTNLKTFKKTRKLVWLASLELAVILVSLVSLVPKKYLTN